MAIEVRWGSATHVGLVRSANQDAVLAGPGVFAVADGMGGHAAGEVASAIVVARMASLPANPAGEAVLLAVQEANEEVITQGAPGTGREGMGTTLSGVAVATNEGRDALLVFNIGDSRTYLLDGSRWEQITQDHSVTAEMVRQGELAAEEARAHRTRNVITRAIGIQGEMELDHWWIDPTPGQMFLICSDGLTNEVPGDDLEEVMRTAGSPQQAVDELIHRALGAGAHDNVSAIAVRVDAVNLAESEIDEDTNPRPAVASSTPAKVQVIDQVPGERADAESPAVPLGELISDVPSPNGEGPEQEPSADQTVDGQTGQGDEGG